MPVFRWRQNWAPFQDLEREVDRLLQGVNLTLQARSTRRFPLINILDEGERYVLTAEIPGVELSDLDLTAADGALTIKGVRKAPPEARDDSFRRQERFQGAWQRTLQLPDRIDEEGMKAEYTVGILKIMLPKTVGTAVRSIPVSEGPE